MAKDEKIKNLLGDNAEVGNIDLNMAMVKTLEAFNRYLTDSNDEDLLVLTNFFYKNGLSKDAFHRATIDEDAFIQNAVQDILKNPKLNISPLKRGRFINAPLTIYDFLQDIKELNESKNLELKKFIAVLDKKDAYIKRLIVGFFISMATGLSLLPFVPSSLISAGTQVIQGLVQTSYFIPVMGVIYTAGIALYSVYQSLYDKKMPGDKKFFNNFFLLTNAGLSIASYSVVLATAVATNPIAAALCVAAAGVKFVKEVVLFARLAYEKRKHGPINENDSLELKQEKIRDACDYVKTRNSVVIEAVSAAAMVGIMAIWGFLPGGILVTVLAVSLIAVVMTVKFAISTYNTNTAKANMLHRFEELETAESNKLEQPKTLDAEVSQVSNALAKLNPTATVGPTPVDAAIPVESESQEVISPTKAPTPNISVERVEPDAQVTDEEAPVSEFVLR